MRSGLRLPLYPSRGGTSVPERVLLTRAGLPGAHLQGDEVLEDPAEELGSGIGAPVLGELAHEPRRGQRRVERRTDDRLAKHGGGTAAEGRQAQTIDYVLST